MEGFPALMLRENDRLAVILTKSISRFGHNTLDTRHSLRDLRSLGVGVYFEQEDMWLNEQRQPHRRYELAGSGLQPKALFILLKTRRFPYLQCENSEQRKTGLL